MAAVDKPVDDYFAGYTRLSCFTIRPNMHTLRIVKAHVLSVVLQLALQLWQKRDVFTITIQVPIWSSPNHLKFQDSSRERWTWTCSLLASLPASTAMTAGWTVDRLEETWEPHVTAMVKTWLVFPYWGIVMDLVIGIEIAMLSHDVWSPLIGCVTILDVCVNCPSLTRSVPQTIAKMLL